MPEELPKQQNELEIPEVDTNGLTDAEKEHFREEILEELESRHRDHGPDNNPHLKVQLKDVEVILEHDLWDEYLAMSEKQKQRFKKEGEHIAKELHQMLLDGTCDEKKSFKKIFKWLKLIPKAEKFTITGAANIKARHILHLK